MEPLVVAVARDLSHNFSKTLVSDICLIEGRGVEGDAHCGETVKHRSRVRVDPTQPNLRQVHLFQAELFEEFSGKGYSVAPGDLGENITTRGVDLLALPLGTILEIGQSVQIELTGYRNPCAQIDSFCPGLLSAIMIRTNGQLLRRTGVMGIVLRDGRVVPEDRILVRYPSLPHKPLERV